MFKLLTSYHYEEKNSVSLRELKYLKYAKDNYLISSNIGDYYGENVTYNQVQNFLRNIGVTQYSLDLVKGLVNQDMPAMGETAPAEAHYYYLLNNRSSGVKTTYKGWSQEVQQPNENQRYLWQYVEVTLPNGEKDITEPIIIQEYTEIEEVKDDTANHSDNSTFDSIEETDGRVEKETEEKTEENDITTEQ